MRVLRLEPQANRSGSCSSMGTQVVLTSMCDDRSLAVVEIPPRTSVRKFRVPVERKWLESEVSLLGFNLPEGPVICYVSNDDM